MPDATWLYAVTAGGDLPPGLRGVAAEPVRSLPCGSLTAVVGTVELAVFGEEPLRRALDDPVRVEHLARTHHEVVEAVARRQAAVPFRLATICLGDERVRAFIQSSRAVLDAVLRRVAGHAEWGVKAYLRPAAPVAADPPQEKLSGTAYLTLRRAQLTRRETAWAQAVSQGEEVHRALAGVATESVRSAVNADDQEPGPDRLVLHAAYLVGHAAADRFADTVRVLSAAGTPLHVTGPWAAYSFTGTLPAHEGHVP